MKNVQDEVPIIPIQLNGVLAIHSFLFRYKETEIIKKEFYISGFEPPLFSFLEKKFIGNLIKIELELHTDDGLSFVKVTRTGTISKFENCIYIGGENLDFLLKKYLNYWCDMKITAGPEVLPITVTPLSRQPKR